MIYEVGIIEDDPMVLSINKRYVSKMEDFNVKATATSVEEAKQLLNDTSITFDLLLIDIHLTSESGLKLVKWLRKEEIDVDFIMVTAISEEETISLCNQYGAIDYILKPFQFDRFKRSLMKFKHQEELLKNKQKIAQEDIDLLYWVNQKRVDKEELVLEKGLTKETLDSLLSLIDEFKGRFTIEELTKKSSLSHVSVRKYVRYLEDNGILEANYTYGTVGRPTMTYRKV